MPVKLVVNSDDPPVGALLTLEHVCSKISGSNSNVKVTWSKDDFKNKKVDLQFLDKDDKVLGTTTNSVARYFARTYTNLELYGSRDPFERTEVDHWLSFAERPKLDQVGLSYLNQALAPRTWLVAKHLTIADICVFSKIEQIVDVALENYPNILRWHKQMMSLPEVQKVVALVAKNVTGEPKKKNATTAKNNTSKRKQEGKFIELPGAEIGKVVVRFPPEASGFLHIGHAKAALLNQYYADNFKGQLIMRFDDTNPAKENVEFEKAILEDLEMLQIKPDRFTHSSDYFDLMLELCTKLLKEAKAYVDDTPALQMKEQRDQKLPSDNRDNPVEKNLSLWNQMIEGTAKGQECCVRAKIDYKSPNGCMRDPTIYRCKPEPHPRTGDKYKVYPTYDFACPIVDAIENVTHTLRTTEYHDRDDQFYWFIEALKLRKPYIWEYSRLNMTNTVLSKRKLTWFVAEGLVDGWDDPRFPTVRGILRRGMSVEGLKQFIIAQGSSRSVVFMEWDKIWAFNKKVIDPIAVRYTALDKRELVKVNVKGAVAGGSLSVANHPKDPSLGTKKIKVGPRILIEREDAEALKEGQNATFINWGNLTIDKVRRADGKVTEVEASLNLDNKDYKNTLKLTWLSADDTESVPCYAVYFEHIINKPVLGKDDDFKDFVAKDTRREVELIGEAELRRVKPGEIIQLQRKGFFRCDVPYGGGPSPYSSREQPIVLFHVPDGHATSNTSQVVSAAADNKPKSVAKQDSKDNIAQLNEQIVAQGNKVRDLKSAKADKATLKTEIDLLLSLKQKYKNATGQDWKPGAVIPPPSTQTAPAASNEDSAAKINDDIVAQGNKVRDLKAAKADKATLKTEIDLLLSLKQKYKNATGQDWKPGAVIPAPSTQTAPAASNEDSAAKINDDIVAQGNKVRDLKAAKADKATLKTEIDLLLSLKQKYKNATGQDWKPGAVIPAPSTQTAPAASNEDSAAKINDDIVAQGNKVRDLKAAKADKATLKTEIDLLLSLKQKYKNATGRDWKPGVVPPSVAPPAALVSASPGNDESVAKINDQIIAQGNKVRDLKAAKADKATLKTEVDLLLSLKDKYKKATGQDWKPPTGTTPAPPVKAAVAAAAKTTEPMDSAKVSKLANDIKKQNEVVNGLQAKKPGAETIAKEVAKLIHLKKEYKEVTGNDWTPLVCMSIIKSDEEFKFEQRVAAQGDKVRELKSKKADKEAVQQEVQALLALKAEFKKLFGKDYAPAQEARESKPKAAKQQVQAPKKAAESDAGNKTGTRLGLEAKKSENLPEWYSQVITKGEMIEYYDVSGCYILRPWSYSIWNVIRDFFDREIKKLGVKDCYFPIFVSKAALEKEKDHIADFAPEVAWVTKSGESDLAEHIAIRPTSETVMYPAFAKWLKSHRDLPLKLNQWNNVVRWEFKHPQPFLRTREFLWQEGHTAFATKAEADEEVLIILELYARVYEEYLAVPVVRGKKTEKEKFAGGDYTTTVEAYISASGRAIQGGTSHHLGQNFSKMFDIQVEGPNEGNEKIFVYQNSWGLTTRTIGVMVMVHGDDKGLVLPPKVAAIQAIVVPCGITASTSPEQKDRLLEECKRLERELSDESLRVEGDYRDNYSPGWKFNHWELKGIPVRVELGPKDLDRGQVTFVRRDTAERITANRNDARAFLSKLLDDVQSNLLQKAKTELNQHIKQTHSWNEFCSFLDKKNLLLAPFCGRVECEDRIKADSAREDAGEEPGAPSMGAKSLCIPFEQPADNLDKLKCIHVKCSEKPKFYTLFGRSY